MRDLSMHVLDIAQNSIKAEATLVTITFVVDEKRLLTLTVEDDGHGMPPELLQRVTDPFITTRTTRRVGLGVPMLMQNAELSGGSLEIWSEVGTGTKLVATFDLNHIDCPPIGEMCDTLLALVILNPDKPDFLYEGTSGERSASLDTRQLREVMNGVPLNEPEVIAWIKESIEEEFKPIWED